MECKCLGCPDRDIGCHSKCTKYKEYIDKNNEQKQKKIAFLKRENMLRAASVAGYKRMTRS